jgi:hypothetical protein
MARDNKRKNAIYNVSITNIGVFMLNTWYFVCGPIYDYINVYVPVVLTELNMLLNEINPLEYTALGKSFKTFDFKSIDVCFAAIILFNLFFVCAFPQLGVHAKYVVFRVWTYL